MKRLKVQLIVFYIIVLACSRQIGIGSQSFGEFVDLKDSKIWYLIGVEKGIAA